MATLQLLRFALLRSAWRFRLQHGNTNHFFGAGPEQVWNTAARSKEFRDFLKDPTIPKKAKSEGLNAVLTELKVSELTKRFFGKPPSVLPKAEFIVFR